MDSLADFLDVQTEDEFDDDARYKDCNCDGGVVWCLGIKEFLA